MFHHLRDHHPRLYKEASTHQELGKKTTDSTSGNDPSTQLKIQKQSIELQSTLQAQELNQPVSIFIAKVCILY